jgi:hypothetical protein
MYCFLCEPRVFAVGNGYAAPQGRVEWVERMGPLSGIPLVESETSRRVGRSGACATLKVVNVMPLDG